MNETWNVCGIEAFIDFNPYGGNGRGDNLFPRTLDFFVCKMSLVISEMSLVFVTPSLYNFGYRNK